nr:unnamed protein product [Callosobruchus analis]
MSDEENDKKMNISDEHDSDSESRGDGKNRRSRKADILQQIHIRCTPRISESIPKLGDLNSLRESYERFRECFPLTPKIWLDWIRDEIKIASSDKEKKQIFHLFDQAVEDYLCEYQNRLQILAFLISAVELWMEYAQYSIGVSDLQTTRSIIERGLTCAGLHASEGHLLWDTLGNWKMLIYQCSKRKLCILPCISIIAFVVDSEEWTAQVKRLGDIFKRQLSVPLMNMENTYEEWQQWHSSLPDGLYDSKPLSGGTRRLEKFWKTTSRLRRGF